MDIRLSDTQRGWREKARRFASEEIAPRADEIDREQTTPADILASLRQSGFLGMALPAVWGGQDADPVSYGLVTEEIARACSSVSGLMTVHNMASQTLAVFGTPDQQADCLPALCAGNKLIAFALTEPEAGSAAHEMQMEAADGGEAYVLNGTKVWITYGQVADLFLVFAQCECKPVALLLERNAPGLSIEPMRDVLGTRGSMLATLQLVDVKVPKAQQIGPLGMGLQMVANVALDHGRFSVAWRSTGILQACLDACIAYTRRRKPGGPMLLERPLIRRQLTDMLVAHTAARALCYRAACLRIERDPRAAMETSLAKYYASSAALHAAEVSVHMHGANGCSPDYPVSRYLRDATVMGIIEGTHEIHQLTLAGYAGQKPYLE